MTAPERRRRAGRLKWNTRRRPHTFLLLQKSTPQRAARGPMLITSTRTTQKQTRRVSPTRAEMPKSCVKVPKGDEREMAAVNPATLCYFKHHDFTLVCSEAAQMGCINFCYYRKIRRLRFEDASLSSSCSGIKKLELWCVSIAESTVAFLFFLLYF